MLCDSDEVEDVLHCEEFGWERLKLLKRWETLRVWTRGWRSLQRKTMLGKCCW